MREADRPMPITARRPCRLLALAGPAALALALALPAPAAADPGAQMFARLTDPMPRARKVQLCAYVARNALDLAAGTPDAAARAARADAAARLTARLAEELARADAALSDDDRAAIARENGEVMGLLSYPPSDAVRAQLAAGTRVEDIGGLFVADVVERCDGLADRLGIAQAPAGIMAAAAPAFRWQGKGAQEAFAGTALVPFASKLCARKAASAADFAAAPLAERGVDGVSLIDWAMACRDKAGLAALLAAGADTAAAGAFGEVPLVRAAALSDLDFLRALLAAGAAPDATGTKGTALVIAYDRAKPGGGPAWQMLRAAGASLDFPDPDGAMWDVWALYADWQAILAHWSAFGSDPVHLARSVSMELERRGGPRGNAAALETLKARLIADFGMCFPVGPLFGMPRDARGHYRLPDCPTLKAPAPAAPGH